MYATSFLPYGRFYNRVGGNIGLLLAYMFLFVYLAFPIFRRPVIVELVLWLIYMRTSFLKNLALVK